MGLALHHAGYKMVGGIMLKHNTIVYISFDSSLRLGMGMVWTGRYYHESDVLQYSINLSPDNETK